MVKFKARAGELYRIWSQIAWGEVGRGVSLTNVLTSSKLGTSLGLYLLFCKNEESEDICFWGHCEAKEKAGKGR